MSVAPPADFDHDAPKDPQKRKQLKKWVAMGAAGVGAAVAVKTGLVGDLLPSASGLGATPFSGGGGSSTQIPSVSSDPVGAPPGSIWYRNDLGVMAYQNAIAGGPYFLTPMTEAGAVWAQPNALGTTNLSLLIFGAAPVTLLDTTGTGNIRLHNTAGQVLLAGSGSATITNNNILDNGSGFGYFAAAGNSSGPAASIALGNGYYWQIAPSTNSSGSVDINWGLQEIGSSGDSSLTGFTTHAVILKASIANGDTGRKLGFYDVATATFAGFKSTGSAVQFVTPNNVLDDGSGQMTMGGTIFTVPDALWYINPTGTQDDILAYVGSAGQFVAGTAAHDIVFKANTTGTFWWTTGTASTTAKMVNAVLTGATDNAFSIGTSTLRTQSYNSGPAGLQVWHTAGDANPTGKFYDAAIQFGPGGSTGVDTTIQRVTAATVSGLTDNTLQLGNTNNRLNAVASGFYNVYNASGDTQPIAQYTSTIQFGPGGSSALDTHFARVTTNTLSGSADNQLLLGNTNNRLQSVSAANGFVVYGTAGDAQPEASFNATSIQFGPGGSTAVDTSFSRTGANALQVTATGTTQNGFTVSTTSLTSGTLFVVSVSGSSAVTGASSILQSTSTGLSGTVNLNQINISGINTNNAVTARGLNISVTNTNATSGTNVGLYIAASGATTLNTAIQIHAGQILSDAAQVWALPSATANAVKLTDGTNQYYAMDTRTTTSGVTVHAWNATAPTIASAAGISYVMMQASAITLTLTGTTGVTALNGLMVNIAQPTVTDASAVTVTTASTVYIAGAPVASGSATITNNYALYIAGGSAYFAGGFMQFPNTESFIFKANQSATLSWTDGTNTYLTFNDQTGTDNTINFTYAVGTGISYASVAGSTHSLIGLSGYTITFTGTTGITALNGLMLDIAAPTVTDTSAMTVTTASTFYIAGAPAVTGSAVITNAYALHVAAGTSAFGGNMKFTGASADIFPSNTSAVWTVTDGTNTYFTFNDQTGTDNTTNYAFAIGTGISYASVAGSSHSMIGTTAYTITFTGTTGITALNGLMVNLAQPTVTDASAMTVTNSSTLYIAGAPIAAGSATLTNVWSLQIAAGKSFFGAAFQLGGALGTTANQFNTASQGAASTQMFIGNSSITVSSDSRLKSQIRPTDRNARSIFSALQVRDFIWNDPADRAEVNRNSRGVWTGIIAQEAIDIVPWLVNAHDRNCQTCRQGTKCANHPVEWRVDWSHDFGLTVLGFQEVYSEVDQLKQRISQLEDEVKELKGNRA